MVQVHRERRSIRSGRDTLTVDYEAHAGLVEKDGRPKGYSICATKSVAVPIPRAYQAFTTTPDLNKWFGPETEISAREGGEFRNADGNHGTLKKVRPDKVNHTRVLARKRGR